MKVSMCRAISSQIPTYKDCGMWGGEARCRQLWEKITRWMGNPSCTWQIHDRRPDLSYSGAFRCQHHGSGTLTYLHQIRLWVAHLLAHHHPSPAHIQGLSGQHTWPPCDSPQKGHLPWSALICTHTWPSHIEAGVSWPPGSTWPQLTMGAQSAVIHYHRCSTTNCCWTGSLPGGNWTRSWAD